MSSREPSPSRSTEQTPLLSRDGVSEHDEANPQNESSEPRKSKQRWPTIIALTLLCVAVTLALIFGFATPAAVEEYAKEAVSYDPRNVSIDSFTSVGIRARIQADVWLDSNKVQKKSIRDLGRFATWIAKEVDVSESHVDVYLPDYDDLLLGSAKLPPFKLNIRNHHRNELDIFTDLEPGDVDGIRRVAKDFMDHKLNTLNVNAVATVPVRSGLINLGKQEVVQALHFAEGDVPTVPKVQLDRLKVAEHGTPVHPDGMKAWAQLSTINPYPVNFDVPPMAFEVLLPDCNKDNLMLATAKSDVIHILPKQNISVSGTGLIKQLPTSLTSTCPGTNKSPLDVFIASYLHGQKTTVYVRGGKQDEETPKWIGELLRDTTLPVPLPVKPFDNAIKNFSLSNVHFSLPETSEQKPVLSATVKVLVGLPENMNFNVDVGRVRADGTVFYEGDEMGKLDLRQWQNARSKKIGADLLVKSEIVDAPLEITDDAVFTRVIQKMIFGGGGVDLGIEAVVDVDATTALGTFVVSGIPGKGQIHIAPLKPGGFKNKVGEITVVDSTTTSLTMQAKVNITNPTDYSAHIPFMNVSLWANGTKLGTAWSSADVKPGFNQIVAYVGWQTGKVGAELLSQYISGYNTSVTIRPELIPGLPKTGLNVTVPMPHMFGKFLRDTTFHIFTSTATFLLFSPLSMFISTIHATAYYNGSEIGTIDYDLPFAVDPGDNTTPRLPVAWNSPGAGLIRDALGGQLKLDAFANTEVRIGKWREKVWFEGRGLGAHVRP